MFSVPFKTITGAAIALVATFMTPPLYAVTDMDSSIAVGPADMSQATLAELDMRTFPGAAEARINTVWTREGTGLPGNLTRIAAIPKQQERFVSGCSE